MPRYSGAFWIPIGSVGFLRDGAEESDELALRNAFDRWRLKHEPTRTGRRRLTRKGDLRRDARLRDGNRDRNRPCGILDDPLHQPDALLERQLIDLAGQSENPDAMHPVANHCLVSAVAWLLD